MAQRIGLISKVFKKSLKLERAGLQVPLILMGYLGEFAREYWRHFDTHYRSFAGFTAHCVPSTLSEEEDE